MTPPPLAPEHLVQLLVAQHWLAIGIFEEAYQAFNALPEHAQRHPVADELRKRLLARG